MAKFICKKCGYNTFVENKSLICPCCGKEGIEKEQDAEELIEEVKDILD